MQYKYLIVDENGNVSCTDDSAAVGYYKDKDTFTVIDLEGQSYYIGEGIQPIESDDNEDCYDSGDNEEEDPDDESEDPDKV